MGDHSEIRKSRGHLLFRDAWEYFAQDGEVFRVILNSPFDVDGRRMGARWECSIAHFERLRADGKVYPFN